MFVTAVFDDFGGKQLHTVNELLFDPADKPGRPMREAIEFNFGERSLVVKALTDTSEVAVSEGTLIVENPNYRIRNASQDLHFQDSIGKRLRNWWVGKNDRGYTDTFMIALDVSRGLCFIAMNNEVSVLTVSGEQWS